MSTRCGPSNVPRVVSGTRLAPERQMLADTGRARGTLREALRSTQMSSTSDFSMSYRECVTAEHQQIIDALWSGNAALAGERMRTHVHASAHSWAGARARGHRHSS